MIKGVRCWFVFVQQTHFDFAVNTLICVLGAGVGVFRQALWQVLYLADKDVPFSTVKKGGGQPPCSAHRQSECKQYFLLLNVSVSTDQNCVTDSTAHKGYVDILLHLHSNYFKLTWQNYFWIYAHNIKYETQKAFSPQLDLRIMLK